MDVCNGFSWPLHCWGCRSTTRATMIKNDHFGKRLTKSFFPVPYVFIVYCFPGYVSNSREPFSDCQTLLLQSHLSFWCNLNTLDAMNCQR